MSCHGLVKCLLFFVNFIFSLIGIGIFVVGVLGIVYIKQINDLYPDMNIPNFVFPAIMIIGTVVFFVSFSGCCGAIKEINCLLIMYIIVMLLLAVAKTAIAVYLLINKNGYENYLEKIVNEVKMTENIPTELHALEFMTKCCGTTGPGSYTDAKVAIPQTCCPLFVSGSADSCTAGKEDLYYQGCKEVITSHKISTFINISSYTFLGIAVFELLSMISALYLTCSRSKAGGYYEYD